MVESETLSRGSLSALRHFNTQQVLNTLRAEATGVTLTELVTKTGLSRPTLMSALKVLIERGWVDELAAYAEAPGRPARQFQFNSSVGLVCGLDIGPHKIDVELADLSGESLLSRRVNVPLGHVVTPEWVAGLVAAAQREVHSDVPLWQVVAGVPGIVAESGRIVRSFVLPDWVGEPAVAELSSALGAPVVFENDANLAALAEFHDGAGRDCKDVVYLMVGTRVSAGAIVQGRLHRGAHGAAGEIGSYPQRVWPDPRATLLSRLGGVSLSYVDESALLARAFAEAELGEPDAVAAVASFCDLLALPLSALILVLDPEVVVIGGGLAAQGSKLFSPLQAAVSAAIPSSSELRQAVFVGNAVVHGAIKLAVGRAESELSVI